MQGSSALKAALKRRLLDEVAVEQGGFVASIYWDIGKFFDSICPGKLIHLAMEQNIDKGLMAIAMQVHMAPRVLKTRGFFGPMVQVSRSILAGCKFSVAFARTAIYWILEQSHARQYVDDIAQCIRGMNMQKVEDECVRDAVQLTDNLSRAGFNISCKSVLVASNARLKNNIHKKLRRVGICIDKDETAKDLGVDAAAGSRRTTREQQKRILKARRRGVKVRWLMKRSLRARKLQSSNLWPAMAYGVSGMGAAPTTVQKMRSTTALAMGGGNGGCVTTTIALEIGQLNDPAIKSRAITIADWVRLWCEADGHLRHELGATWTAKLAELKGRANWKKVKGPLGAVICTLIDIGINPRSPDMWVAPGGATWRIDDRQPPQNPNYFAKLISSMVGVKLWKKAAEHRAGQGVQEGVDLSVLVRHLGSLHKNEQRAAAGVLKKAAIAGLWTAERKFAAGLIATPVCPRCRLAPEDEFHRVWECKANEEGLKDHIDPKILCNNLKQKAIQGKDDNMALWTRGIVPKAMTDTIPPRDIQGIIQISDDPPTAGRFYLDGSGGVNTADKRLRRCGWAAIKMKEGGGNTPEVHQGVYGALAGAVQTVPRAEITAALNLLRTLQGSPGDIHMVSDCKLVVDGFAEKMNTTTVEAARRFPCSDANQDLWQEVVDMTAARTKKGYRTWITKVKAHVEEFHILADIVSWDDFVGNEFADAFAKIGAEINQLEKSEVDRVKQVDREAWTIQSRIIVTNMDALKHANRTNEGDEEFAAREDRKNKKDKREKKKTNLDININTILDKSNHMMVRQDSEGRRIRWKCSRCLCVRSEKALRRAYKSKECCSSSGLPHGWVDTMAWIALKKWASKVVDNDEENLHDIDINIVDLEAKAKEEVARCGASWTTVAAKAVHKILQDRQVASESGEDAMPYDNQHVTVSAGSGDDAMQYDSQHVTVSAGSGQNAMPYDNQNVTVSAGSSEDVMPYDNHQVTACQETCFEEEDPFHYGLLSFDGPNDSPQGENGPHHHQHLHLHLPPPPDEPHGAEERETDRERLRRLQASLASRRLPSCPAMSLRRSDFQLGNLHMHASHTLHHHRGVIWCWACGAYATETLRDLQGVCSGTPGRGRVHALKRLRQGATPRVGMEWPLAVGACRPSGPIVA